MATNRDKRSRDSRAGEAEVARTVLPNGRQVDVVWFEERRSKRRRRSEAELHICPECVSDLVYPTDWAPAGSRSWRIDLRCPDCEWRGSGTYDQEIVDRFDIELDQATDSLIDDLTHLTRANMEEDVERFVAALAADHLLPEDF